MIRPFKTISTFLATPLALSLCLVLSAQAQQMKLGIVAPTQGDFAILGSQIRIGVGAALATSAPVATVPLADECTPQSGQTVTDRLIQEQVTAVVGFICTESLLAALPRLRDANIPVITPAVRTPSLTNRRDATRFLIFRLAPRADAEEAGVAKILVDAWRDQHFAIVDDGTLYGRELAEGLRTAAEQAGLKPVFVDTYRPQLESQASLVARLRNSGATHVFVGGDRSDIAVIAENARTINLDLTIAGGESLLLGNQPLPSGTLAIAPFASTTSALPSSLRKVTLDGYVLPAFAATQALLEAARIGGVQRNVLGETSFDTVLGPLRFDEKGDAELFAYRLLRFDGSQFMPLAEDAQ